MKKKRFLMAIHGKYDLNSFQDESMFTLSTCVATSQTTQARACGAFTDSIRRITLLSSGNGGFMCNNLENLK